MSRRLRWRYDPTLDRVVFKAYVPGEEGTAAVRLMTGAELIALADDHSHRILRSLKRMVESHMPVGRETEADPELLALLGID